jgi:hypothetical protein
VRRSLDPGNLPGALRVAVKEALDSGWTAKKGGSGGWKLRSPGATEWMHVAPGTNIPDNEARKLRTLVARALLNEAPKDVVEAAKDPKEYGVTTTCTVCKREFLAWDGFVAHQDGCLAAAAAAYAAEQEAKAAEEAAEIPEAPRPLPGYNNSANLPTPSHRPDLPKASDSGKMSNKEEVVVNTGNKRGSYRKRQYVREGLARALYEAMRKRSRTKTEALSTYANALAKIMDDDGFDYSALEDSESKLLAIMEVLDIDPTAGTKVAELEAENQKLGDDLAAIKDLINGMGGGK